TAGEHLDTRGQGVVHARTGSTYFELRHGLFNAVGIRGKIEQLVNGVAERNDRSFSAGAEDLLGKKNAGLSHARQERLDALAAFEQKDHREGITAHIKVRDPLLDAVVEDAEVVLLQVEEHLSTGVADGHRRVDLKNARLDLRRRLLLMGLHRRAWL